MRQETIAFDEELKRLTTDVHRLQHALRAALDTVLPADQGARACSRALGITRSLGWGVWNLASSPDIAAALRALPGAKGWELICTGLERRDCPFALLASLRSAISALDREMRSVRVQPSMLRSMAAGALDSDAQLRKMRAARKRARQAAEVLFGVHAKAFLGAMLAGPPNARGVVDVAGVSLFEGLTRSRPGPAWPIFEGILMSARTAHRPRPLVHGAIPGLMEEYCTEGAVNTALRTSGSKDYLVAFVAQAMQGRARGVRAAFGQLNPSAGSVTSRRRAGSRQTLHSNHLGLIASAPVELAVFDMLLHRDIPVLADPVGALYGPPDPWPLGGISHGEPDRLEAKRMMLDSDVERPRSLQLPAAAATLSVPWRGMLGCAAKALGHPLEDFVHFRLVVRDPPMHGRVMMRWTARPMA
jgi:hypothetical protein